MKDNYSVKTGDELWRLQIIQKCWNK
jgi:hypothetical protein